MRKTADTALTAEKLRELLDYEPETGLFYWKVQRRCVHAGREAGSGDGRGYRKIWVSQRSYSAHRLAWMYVHGEWPQGHIDHINGLRSDNRIANLRVCTNADNGQNRGINANNRSGFVGVSFHRQSHKWQAHINAQGKRHSLGEFDDKDDAAKAYAEAKLRLHSFQPVLRVA